MDGRESLNASSATDIYYFSSAWKRSDLEETSLYPLKGKSKFRHKGGLTFVTHDDVSAKSSYWITASSRELLASDLDVSTRDNLVLPKDGQQENCAPSVEADLVYLIAMAAQTLRVKLCSTILCSIHPARFIFF